jgi:hypothetical protein
MQTWLPADDDEATATARLNDFGYDGWELIMVGRATMRDEKPIISAWFKRQREPKREPNALELGAAVRRLGLAGA